MQTSVIIAYFCFILCLNWFNPAVWLFYHFVNRDTEISCDKYVVQVIGEEEKGVYAMNLLYMAGSKEREYTYQNGFTKKVIEERIVAIFLHWQLLFPC